VDIDSLLSSVSNKKEQYRPPNVGVVTPVKCIVECLRPPNSPLPCTKKAKSMSGSMREPFPSPICNVSANFFQKSSNAEILEFARKKKNKTVGVLLRFDSSPSNIVGCLVWKGAVVVDGNSHFPQNFAGDSAP